MIMMYLVLPVMADFDNWSPSISIKLTTPQKMSLSLGISGTSWGGLFDSDTGLLIRLEPGISGGKLNPGTRHTFSMAMIPVFSMDICASVMYT